MDIEIIVVGIVGMPDRVQNVRGTTYTSVMIVTWDSLGPNMSYCITATKATKQSRETCDLSETSFVFSHLDPGALYEFVVAGVNDIGRGPPSYPVLTNFSFGELRLFLESAKCCGYV